MRDFHRVVESVELAALDFHGNPFYSMIVNCKWEKQMTIVVKNASQPLARALKEMAKLDGASVSVEKDNDTYPKTLVKSLLKADKEIERERKRGTLRSYDSVEALFADL